MKVYEYGNKSNKSIMILPSAYKNLKIYENLITSLEKNYHVLLISYTGFTEGSNKDFHSLSEETIRIEEYIKKNLKGKVDAVYATSTGEKIINEIMYREEVKIKNIIINHKNISECIIIPKILSFMFAIINYKKINNIKMHHIKLKNIYNMQYSTLITKIKHIKITDTNLNIIIQKKNKDKVKNKLKKYYENIKYIELTDNEEENVIKNKDKIINKLKKKKEKKND